jgi:hypothetical protein
MEDLGNLIEIVLGVVREIEGRMEKLRDYGRRDIESCDDFLPRSRKYCRAH